MEFSTDFSSYIILFNVLIVLRLMYFFEALMSYFILFLLDIREPKGTAQITSTSHCSFF